MPVLTGVVVFAFACGSSSVATLTRIGHDVRWVALAALLAAAAAWAFARRGTGFPLLVPSVAAGFLALALLSTLWSVSPRLSFERAVSLAVLLAAALLVSFATRGDGERIGRILIGLLGGATAVALGGLLALLAAHGDAVEAATYESPARFRGLGENANTASLLFALALPIAVARLLAAQNLKARLGFALVLALLGGSIVASGSRGALAAAAVGALAPVLLRSGPSRRRALGLAAVAVAVVAGALVQSLPAPSTTTSSPTPAPARPAPAPGFLDAEVRYPLDADIGRPLPGGGEPPVRRTFFAASGRGQAWAGAIRQALQRPLVGHGFGTEGNVFVDRYYAFVGGLPESSYIGLALQLGAVGLLALLALVLALAASARTALGRASRVGAAASVGVLAAGLAVAFVQSYLYSAGNIASSTFWIAAFLLPAAASADA